MLIIFHAAIFYSNQMRMCLTERYPHKAAKLQSKNDECPNLLTQELKVQSIQIFPIFPSLTCNGVYEKEFSQNLCLQLKSEFKEVVKSLKQQTLKISIQLARRLISMTDVVTLSTCCTWSALGVSVGKRNALRQQMYWMPLTEFQYQLHIHSMGVARICSTKPNRGKRQPFFIQFSPNVARRFTKKKSFPPVAGHKAKEQNENIRNSQCERRLGSFSLLLHFFSFTFPLLFSACSPKRRAKVERKPTHNKRKDLC